MGVGVPQDDAEGVRWYRLAADQSYVPALTNLGNMYETGEGVPQDYVQAYVWYDLAASQLCCQMLQRAIEHRYRVGGLMNSTQVAEARRLARGGTPRTRVSRKLSHGTAYQPAVGSGSTSAVLWWVEDGIREPT